MDTTANLDAETASPDDLRAILATAPDDAATRMDLAEQLSDAGDAPAAIAEMRLALAALRLTAAPSVAALDRRQIRATLALADALAEAGHPDTAESHRARARAGHGPHAEGALADARRALAAGDAARAREACEMALAMAPERAEAHLIAADLIDTDAPLDQQVGHLAAAAAAAQDDAEVRLRLGLRLRTLDHPAAAAAALRGALRLDPTLFEAWHTLTVLLQDDGQDAAALPLARHLVTLDDGEVRGHLALAGVLDALGQTAEAVDAMTRALDLDPDQPAIRDRRARRLERLGRWDDALEARREAVRRDPGREVAVRALADTLARLGHHAEAVTWYRRAVDIRPTSRTLNGLLAEALMRREHWEAVRAPRDIAAPRRSDHDLPPWEGSKADDIVLLHHRTADGVDALLLGLGVAAAGNLRAVCAIRRSVEALVRRALPSADILVREDTPDVGHAAKTLGATAQVRFRDLPAVMGAPLAVPAWLAAAPPPQSRWAVVHPPAGTDAPKVPAPKASIWRGLAAALGPETVEIDGGLPPESLAEALAGASAVITADGPAAHVAGAMGLRGIVVLPPDAPWQWGDRTEDTPFYPRLTTARSDRPDVWDGALQRISDLIATRLSQHGTAPPPRPVAPDQLLAETLDRVAPWLGGAHGPVECTPLAQGRRNLLFTIATPEGARLLRLPKFPPRRPDEHVIELHNMRRAAEAHVAPPVLYGDTLDGTLLTAPRDEVGALASDDLHDPAMASAAAGLYRHLHQTGGFRGRYDPMRRVEGLSRYLRRSGDSLFRRHDAERTLFEDVLAVLRANRVPRTSCHNVPVAKSFRGAVDTLALSGWEASGTDDPHWEVAALCARADLPAPVRDIYYATYLGDPDAPQACRLILWEAVTCWWRWMVAVDNLHDAPEDEDYQADADRWRARLDRRLEDSNFAKALEQARTYRHDGA